MRRWTSRDVNGYYHLRSINGVEPTKKDLIQYVGRFEDNGLEPDEIKQAMEDEKNEPLTLDEIKRERYVWIEPLKDWAKVTPYGLLYFGTKDYTDWNECCELGRLWNAYRYMVNRGQRRCL